jgi:hypothetical protein
MFRILAAGLAWGIVALVLLLSPAEAQGVKRLDDPFGDIDLESLKKGKGLATEPAAPKDTEAAPMSPPGDDARLSRQIIEPVKGSSERTAILNVVRASVESRLGIKIGFVVERLAIFGDWAFASLHPRTKAGKRINYRKTRYAQDYHPDLDSDFVDVLLRRRGGSWTIVQEAFLPTDVVWEEWERKYNLPRKLFLVEE